MTLDVSNKELMRIGLVACCSIKRESPSVAKDLYISPLFVKSRAYVEKVCDGWAILSARHGLVMPDTIISPYDETLSQKSTYERCVWAHRTAEQIKDQWGVDAAYVALAGQHYLYYLATCYQLRIINPLAGLGIGRRLQWLNRQLVKQG